MKRDFNKWLLNLKDSIADWKYYTDFEKVYHNVENIKLELNLLNSLINSKDIENDFKELVSKYPEVLTAIPILLAKRELEIKINDIEGYHKFNFDGMKNSIDDYTLFMKETGLFDLLANHIISDLTDYVKGIEVGLDSNARKNRTGTLMENLVEQFLVKNGFEKNKTYFAQMRAKDIYTRFGIDVSNLDKENRAEKRFDFVIKTPNYVYGIEVNFYSGGGSKLNETARSYKMVTLDSREIEHFKFVWITDGIGWLSAKANLEETFNVLDHLYNLEDLYNGEFIKNIK